MHRLIHPSPSRSLVLAAGLVLCGSVATTPAMAATISYSFNGIVTHVGSEVSSAFANPSAMYGSMTVDTSNSSLSATTGYYNIQTFQISFSGGYTATMSPFGSWVEIQNESTDIFSMLQSSPEGASINGLLPAYFFFSLEGPSNIFSSDALPNSVPSVISFTSRDLFRLQFGRPLSNDTTTAVSGFVTSLTVVPLPGAVVLFGIGLLSLVGLGARGRRTLRGPQA